METGAAFRTVTGINLSFMHLDNRLTYRQPKPNTRNCRFFIAAGKFIKNRLFLAGRNTGPGVPDFNIQAVRLYLTADPDSRLMTGLLHRILKQVN